MYIQVAPDIHSPREQTALLVASSNAKQTEEQTDRLKDRIV